MSATPGTFPSREMPARPDRVAAPAPRGVFHALVQAVPTGIVIVGLAAMAWFGHHTGWRLPSLASLRGETPAPVEEFCSAHNVPEAICVECRPELLSAEKAVGWCAEHGVPVCPLCHPELAQTKTPPEVTAPMRERALRALAFSERPENAKQCKLHERHIQFASQEAVEKAAIEIAPVWESPIVEAVSASGEIGYDETRLAHMSSRVAGTLWRAEKQAGDRVRQGELLALVDSTEVGRAKSDFLQALAQTQLRKRLLDSMRKVFDRGAASEVSLREAETAYQESAIRLTSAEQALVNLGLAARATEMQGLASDELARRVQFLGLPEALQARLAADTTTTNLFPLKAPLDGIVVERHGVIGEVVDPSKVLFVVADTSRMWLALELRIEDARQVQPGQTVRFVPDGSNREVTGTISWISTSVDEKTRTIRVRAELENADGRLRAGTFGRGRVMLREEPKAIVVPNSAVQWEGDCHVVFVRDRNFFKEGAPKLFQVRKVRIGARDDEHTEIIAGVLPGEIVATAGSAILRSQLLKSNLGEGCGCHH